MANKSTYEKALASGLAANRRYVRELEAGRIKRAERAQRLARIMQDPIAFHSATQYHGMELTGSHQPAEDALLREALGWAEIAHRAIADRISMLRPTVHRRIGEELEPVPDHPLQSLLDKPNEDFTRAATQRLLAGHLVLVGEAYLLKVRAKGLRRPGAARNIPTELWLMHPARTTPILVGGRITGFLVHDGDGNELAIAREDVIRLWLPDVENIYGSRGYLGPQAATVDADKFSDETMRSHFQHDAVPRVVIEAKDDAPKPSDPELRRHDELWRAAYNRRIGQHRGLPAWLPTGFSVKELSALGGMTELVPLKNHYRDKVLMAFGVPRSIVGDVVDANRAAAETNQYVFDLHTVSPLTGVVADGYTAQLAPDFGDDLVVLYEDFVASDKNFELTRTESELRSKIRVINEVREERGEDEVAWGDLPVGTIAEQPYTGEEPEPFEPFEAEDEDEDDDEGDDDRTRTLRPAPPEVRAEWEREVNNERRYVPTFDKGVRAIFRAQERAILKALQDADTGRQMRALTDTEIRGILADLLGGPDAFKALFEKRVERYRRRAYEQIGAETFESVADQAGLDLPGTFQYTSAAAANLAGQARGFRQVVNQTTLKRLTKDVMTAVAEGIAEGDSAEQVAKRIEKAVRKRMKMQRSRSRQIAQTEMGIATSQAKLDGWGQSGIVAGKRWHTSLDDAVRDSHIPMEGQTVALGVPFILPDTGEQAEAPRLGVGGARLSPHNAIGCRCFTSAVLDIGES